MFVFLTMTISNVDHLTPVDGIQNDMTSRIFEIGITHDIPAGKILWSAKVENEFEIILYKLK
jgi:hypothetical protein